MGGQRVIKGDDERMDTTPVLDTEASISNMTDAILDNNGSNDNEENEEMTNLHVTLLALGGAGTSSSDTTTLTNAAVQSISPTTVINDGTTSVAKNQSFTINTIGELFSSITLERKHKNHLRPKRDTIYTFDQKMSAHKDIISMTTALGDGSDIHIDAIENAVKDGVSEEEIEMLIFDLGSKKVNSRPLNETFPAVFPTSMKSVDVMQAFKLEQGIIRDVYIQGKLVICSQVNGEEKISKYHVENPILYNDIGMIKAISELIIDKQHYAPYRFVIDCAGITRNKQASECMDIFSSVHHFQTSAFRGDGFPHQIVEALQHRSLANSNFNNWNPNPNQGMALLWHSNANIGQPPPRRLRHLPAHRNMYAHISYFPTVEAYIGRIGLGTINRRIAYLSQHHHWNGQFYINHLRKFEGVPCLLPGNDLIIPDWATFPQLFEKQLHRELNTGFGIYDAIRVLSNNNIGVRRQEMETRLVSVQNRHQQSLPGLYPQLYSHGFSSENYNVEGDHWYASTDHGSGLISQITKYDRYLFTRPASHLHPGGEFGSSVSYHCLLNDDVVEAKGESLSNIGKGGFEHIIRGKLPVPIFGSAQYVFGPPGHTLTNLHITEYVRNYRPLYSPVKYWLECKVDN